MKTRGLNTILLIAAGVVWICGISLWGQNNLQDGEIHSNSLYWWHVVITINVKGSYEYKKENSGIDGKYSFTATILGSLLEDEEDYIFVQAFQEIKNLQWIETVHSNDTGRTFDLKEKVKLDATLNYVFKNKKILAFDFNFSPITTPNNNQVLIGPIKQVILPESAGDASINVGDTYNPGVISGSNQVSVGEIEIYDNKFYNNTFQWTWQDKDNTWINKHLAGATLKITRIEK
jgi:hypothetical protein